MSENVVTRTLAHLRLNADSHRHAEAGFSAQVQGLGHRRVRGLGLTVDMS